MNNPSKYKKAHFNGGPLQGYIFLVDCETKEYRCTTVPGMNLLPHRFFSPVKRDSNDIEAGGENQDGENLIEHVYIESASKRGEFYLDSSTKAHTPEYKQPSYNATPTFNLAGR